MRLNFNMVYRNKKMVMLLWKSVHLNSRLLLWLKLWLNRLHLVTVCGASTPLPKMLLDWKVHQITTLTISALKQFIQVVRWCNRLYCCLTIPGLILSYSLSGWSFCVCPPCVHVGFQYILCNGMFKTAEQLVFVPYI